MRAVKAMASLRIAHTLMLEAVVSSEAKGINFGLVLHLRPYFVYASSEGSGKSAHMRRLTWVFAAR